MKTIPVHFYELTVDCLTPAGKPGKRLWTGEWARHAIEAVAKCERRIKTSGGWRMWVAAVKREDASAPGRGWNANEVAIDWYADVAEAVERHEALQRGIRVLAGDPDVYDFSDMSDDAMLQTIREARGLAYTIGDEVDSRWQAEAHADDISLDWQIPLSDMTAGVEPGSLCAFCHGAGCGACNYTGWS